MSRNTSQPLRRSEGLARGSGPLKRQTGLGRGKPKRGVSIPKAVRAEVKARSRGRCIVCSGRGAHLHHVLPQAKWPEHALEPANLVLVCPGCHDEHERAHRRIPLAALPSLTVAYARMVGLGVYIDRTYPAFDWRHAGV